MSIDSRFSKDRFQAEVLSNPSSRRVSDELQGEVLAMLQHGVSRLVNDIVESLNEQGHKLRLYYPAELGDISFRDDRVTEGAYQCDLRLGVDIVVSVGFRDTVTGESEPAENGWQCRVFVARYRWPEVIQVTTMNSSGNGVDSINNQKTSKDCGETVLRSMPVRSDEPAVKPFRFWVSADQKLQGDLFEDVIVED